MSCSAILQISCPSKTRWHHHTKDYKQIASCQSTNKVSLSCQVLAISACDSQEQVVPKDTAEMLLERAPEPHAMSHGVSPRESQCCTSGVWIECVTSHTGGFSTRLLSGWVGSILDTVLWWRSLGTILLATFWAKAASFISESMCVAGGKDQSNRFKKPIIIFASFVQNRGGVQNISPCPVASTKATLDLVCGTHNQLRQCNSSHQLEEKKFCWKHRQVAVSIFH